jgi:hypothetical protein
MLQVHSVDQHTVEVQPLGAEGTVERAADAARIEGRLALALQVFFERAIPLQAAVVHKAVNVHRAFAQGAAVAVQLGVVGVHKGFDARQASAARSKS